jgi:hypothetical protein
MSQPNGRLRTVLALGILGGTGCHTYALETPEGFVEVTRSDSSLRLKGQDGTGLHVRTFDNPEGGTLAYWSLDLVRKLQRRAYKLEDARALESKNGVAGVQLQFSYRSVPSGDDKSYGVALFVSDAHRLVVQLAGPAEYDATYRDQLASIAAEIEVRGCKLGSKVCDGEVAVAALGSLDRG